MAKWQQKRFWKKVDIRNQSNGFEILLDGKVIKTPAKNSLVLPNRLLAEEIAEEWRKQSLLLEPNKMPFTKISNSAIDKISQHFVEVADHLTEYAQADLLCYRVLEPEELSIRQSTAWDPLLEWASKKFNSPLHKTKGLVYVEQKVESVKRLKKQIYKMTSFELAAFYELVTLTGSIIAALAIKHGNATAEIIWDLCHIEERWQQEHWGIDEEAETISEIKRLDFFHAERYLKALKSGLS